jgi:hypothetical protein
MVDLETWIGLGCLSMAIMFVALMFSFYFFLIGPEGKGPEVSTDPGALLIQIISISGAPSLILAGTVVGVARRPRGKTAGVILIISGVLLAVAMSFLTNIVPRISYPYLVSGINFIPTIFIAAGIGVIGCGLFVLKKVKNQRSDLGTNFK